MKKMAKKERRASEETRQAAIVRRSQETQPFERYLFYLSLSRKGGMNDFRRFD